jgi:hypothetical protein
LPGANTLAYFAFKAEGKKFYDVETRGEKANDRLSDAADRQPEKKKKNFSFLKNCGNNEIKFYYFCK